MRSREVGQVSFNMRDGYERRLYEHAHKTEHGEFSKYIKRLIERDLMQSMTQVVTPATAKLTASSFDVNDEDVGAFL